METYKTLGTSTLSTGVNSSLGAISVADSTKFPTGGQPTFRVIVDSEIMLVTANPLSGVLSVTRGYEGSTAASHSSGAVVSHIATQGMMDVLRDEDRQSGSYATMNTASFDGRFALITDQPHFLQDRGSSIRLGGHIHKMTPPIATNFTWLNQNSAVANNTNQFLYLGGPTSSVINVTGLEINTPTPPYTITAYLLGNWFNANTFGYGMYHRETSSGKIISLQYTYQSYLQVQYNRWNSTTSLNVVRVPWTNDWWGLPHPWFRLEHNGSDLKYWLSANGYTWRLYAQDTQNAWFTTGPDRIGLMIQTGTGGTGYTVSNSCLHWLVA